MPHRTVFSQGAACKTQMHLARRGELTPEMERLAAREELEPTHVRDEVARGRMSRDWNRQFELALDPETARAMHHETLADDYFKKAEFCSMHNFRDVDWDALVAAGNRRPAGART